MLIMIFAEKMNIKHTAIRKEQDNFLPRGQVLRNPLTKGMDGKSPFLYHANMYDRVTPI